MKMYGPKCILGKKRKCENQWPSQESKKEQNKAQGKSKK